MNGSTILGGADEVFELPAGTGFEASAISLYEGVEYHSTALVNIYNFDSNEKYEISDISGGFYDLFNLGNERYVIGPSCGTLDILLPLRSCCPIISTNPIVGMKLTVN